LPVSWKSGRGIKGGIKGMISSVSPIYPVDSMTVYWENRMVEKIDRSIPATAQPHLVYDKHGNIIKVPDQSWGIAV